jgi:hypothetical protein
MPIVAALLVRGVANLDPASILVAVAPIVGACLVVFYARKLLARRRRKVPVGRPVSVSDARLYGRYRTISDALGVRIAREPQKAQSSAPGGRRMGWTSRERSGSG